MWNRDSSVIKDSISVFLISLVALIALISCSDNSSGNKSESQIQISEQPSGSLVIYSGRSESLVGSLIDQFEEVSGVDVSVKYGKTSEIVAMVQEEGKNSPADVIFAQDPSGLGALNQVFTTLPEDLTSRVPIWAQSSTGKWVGISGRARTVVYNTDRLTETDLPTSLEGFVDSKWNGRIGWAPSNASFQAMVTSMRALWGEDRTRTWLEGIQSNNPRLYPKNTPIVAAAAAGEIDVGFVNHYYLHRFIQENGESFTARNYFINDGGPGALVMAAGTGVLSTSKNVENAYTFIRFLLSPVAQAYFSNQTFEYPMVDGVKVSRLLLPLEEINSPVIDPESIADLSGTQELLRLVGITP